MNKLVSLIFILSCSMLFFFACDTQFYNPFGEDTYVKPTTVPEPSPAPTSSPTTPPILPVSMPVMNPAGGTYDSDISISITCSTASAIIRYTTDGSDPDEDSDKYSLPIEVTGNGTTRIIKAYAVKAGMSDSAIGTEEYTINYNQVSTPFMSVTGGTYDTDQGVAISCSTTDAIIRYTTNGNDPDQYSPEYETPIDVAGHGTTMTIKAYAVKTGMLDSTIRTENYTIIYSPVDEPVMSPIGGTYYGDKGVVISCSTTDAIIRYTTNGNDPDQYSPEYETPIDVAGHGTTMTIKAYAVKTGMLDSSIRTENYTIQYPAIFSITSSTEDGAYGTGDDINVTVNFSQPVTLAGGTLDITLDTGKTVSITAFGSASSASCIFSVGSGELSNDLDATAISLNGGTLRNSVNTDVIVSLPATTIKTGSDIVVDGYLPVITGFSLTSGSPVTDHFITFSLNGSDNGTGITHWLINESTIKPAYNDPGWVTSKPDKYTLSTGYGTKSVYAWAKDGVSNISNMTGNSTFNVVVEYNGAASWTFEKNIAGNENPKGMTVDYNDNVYVVGLKENGTNDWQIIKVAPDGTEDTTNWNKSFDWYGGSDSAQAVVTDSENNVYVAGWFTDGSDPKWGIIKYTTNGAEVWTDEWNYSTGDDDAQGIAIDSNDNIYVTGCIENGSGDYDWWMKKYDPDGNEDTVNWNFGFDSGYGDDTAISVDVDSADNVYIAGQATNSSANLDGMVRKYSSNGSLIWSRVFDHAGKYDRAYSLAIDSNDNVYVAGFVTQADNNIDWCIKKYDSDGTEDTANWDKVIDYGTDDVAWGITTDSGNNVFAGGRLLYSSNEWTVIKFNSGGTEISRDVIINTGNDWCRAMIADSMDYVYGTGGVYRSGTGTDLFIKKYAP